MHPAAHTVDQVVYYGSVHPEALWILEGQLLQQLLQQLVAGLLSHRLHAHTWQLASRVAFKRGMRRQWTKKGLSEEGYVCGSSAFQHWARQLTPHAHTPTGCKTMSGALAACHAPLDWRLAGAVRCRAYGRPMGRGGPARAVSELGQVCVTALAPSGEKQARPVSPRFWGPGGRDLGRWN